MTATIIILSTLLSASPQPELRTFLARRAYDSAVHHYSARLSRQADDVEAMCNLARVYDHWHKYDSSLAWWSRVLEISPNDDSAIVGRWYAMYRRDEGDSLKLRETKKLIASEAAFNRLPIMPLSEAGLKTPRWLTRSYDGLSVSDTVGARLLAWQLATQYPSSPRGHEVTGNMFYDSLAPVWTNDTLKVPLIKRFLVRLPRTEWRQTFYMFLLSSRFGLKDTAGLRGDAAEMVADDTLDPFRYRYAAALFNRLQFDPETAETYARKAIALEPNAEKPTNKPQEQWDIEYPSLRGSALLALAEALKLQGKLAEAETPIMKAIDEFRWDPQQEATPGPFYCLLGEIKESQRDTTAAVTAYAKALEAGDSRNYWSPRADSGIMRLRPITPAAPPHRRTVRGMAVTDLPELEFRRVALHGAYGFFERGPSYNDVTDSFGLKDRHESRVAWGDYNNDEYQDLLLNGSVLFRNDSGRGFTNVTDSVGLTDAKGRGGLFADFNNDGWLDLYVAAGEGGARFYKNDSGRFVYLSDRAGGPDGKSPTEGAGFADFDNDGWVDLYCANYENWEKHEYYPDQLFQNQHGYFADVTNRSLLPAPYSLLSSLAGRGVNWGDFNNDGYQDCYVSNYRLCENILWVNNHDSTFSNLAGRLGVAGDEANGWYGHTIGSEWGDYDNDGDLDLFCANLAHPRYIEFSNRSMLYENSLGPSPVSPSSLVPRPSPLAPRPFTDVRAASGIRFEETHSDPAWADVDNDGDLDLYITSIYEGRRSFLYENQGKSVTPREARRADSRGLSGTQGDSSTSLRYAQNDNGVSFRDVTWLSGTRVFNGWGCAFADFDNDGDQDLVVGSGSGVRLFRNDTKNGNNWLEVRVIGRTFNRAGIGARVTVTQGKSRQIREVEGGKGTMSQNSLVQHFGLGRSDTPVTVEVRFGPRSRTVIKGVKPNQLITIEERP